MPAEKQEVYIQCRYMQKADLESICNIDNDVNDFASPTTIVSALGGNDTHAFVALHGGIICAYCAFTCTLDVANLDALVVQKMLRRKGIANALLTFSMGELLKKNINIFWLEVRSENTAAIKLYEALNFRQNGLRKNYYKNPKDDAVLMEYTLNDKREGKF